MYDIKIYNQGAGGKLFNIDKVAAALIMKQLCSQRELLSV